RARRCPSGGRARGRRARGRRARPAPRPPGRLRRRSRMTPDEPLGPNCGRHSESLCARNILGWDAGLPFAGGGGVVSGWETSERVLESGCFESRQRVLVAEPAVEASEAGARTLGITYWQSVDRFTRGGVRASWTGEGGKLKLLGGATLL